MDRFQGLPVLEGEVAGDRGSCGGREADSGRGGGVLEEEVANGGAAGDLADLVTQMTMRNDEVKKELECPVCLEEMKPPKQIWICQNGHSVCGECRAKVAGRCPSCHNQTRLDRRCIAMEKMAVKLFL